MAFQLHAGQRRYHDFPKLRELHLERLHQGGIVSQRREFSSSLNLCSSARQTSPSLGGSVLNGSSSLLTGNNASMGNIACAGSGVLALNSGVGFQPEQQPQQSRSFLSAALSSRLSNLRLKQLERTANSNPTDPSAQYDFLSELSQRYPDAVVERFERFDGLAVDERCALLYFGALQRINGQGRFNLGQFVGRMQAGGGTVHPVKMQALTDLAASKGSADGRKMTKAQQATAAMQIVAGATAAGAMGSATGAGAGASALGGATAGLGSLGGVRGADPRYPLHVQMHSPGSGRAALFTLARHVVVVFIAASALMAVFDERGVGRAMGMGGKHVQEAEGSEVKFDDVKGVKEAKAELEEIVQYLKDPEKFTRLGGKLPRGLLLTGPPGTGKTLLAKAIAGEAGVPFFFSSGSQFEEVYVGLGAKRVRELFEAAKKKSPAIIFIDEIDAVGGTRRLKDQSALKMTLNELLVQLDGFEENSGIIVIGATNFSESLDKALMRPGRFDKHVTVPLPDVGGRKEILEMYASKTRLADDVDLSVLARGTAGMSGADLYNLMNQAALKASIDGLESITHTVLEYAKDKIRMGAERKSAVITEKSLKNTAYHEAGHALVAILTEGALPIDKATVMPRGSALGYVSWLPEGDQNSESRKEMVAHMDVCMGGRVAEELIFGPDEVSSGASADIQYATTIARNMVTKWGFSEEVGIVNHGGDNGQEASGATRATIDEEVRKLTDAAYKRATDLLKKHSREHKLLAETLIEYETMTGDEVRDLVLKGKKPDRSPLHNPNDGKGGRNTEKIDLGSKDGGKGQKDGAKGGGSKGGSRFPGFGGKVGSRQESQ